LIFGLKFLVAQNLPAMPKVGKPIVTSNGSQVSVKHFEIEIKFD
jgi:hypothetical protein